MAGTRTCPNCHAVTGNRERTCPKCGTHLSVTAAAASKLVDKIVGHGLKGVGPMCSAEQLAAEYEADTRYSSTDQRVRSMTRWEAAKNFGSGFVTGLGGLPALPFTLPSGLYAAWIVQARLAGAIAKLHGHDVLEDRVRTLVVLSLLGDAGKEVLKQMGVVAANRAGRALLERLPGRMLIELNKKVGFRLATKAGTKGIVNLAKVVPVLGGVVGGSVDTAACVAVGRTAHALFRP